MSNKLRFGIGYDVHSLSPGHRLVLGGVDIPHEKGLTSWSDGDVVIHAIMDALLGAAALGDIGGHFPPGDPRYKDISSLVMLEKVKEELDDNGWKVSNVDTTILAEKPKLIAYIGSMRDKLSQALGIPFNQVSVKASTTDQLGFVGRGEGIAAYAVAILEEK